MVTTFPPGRVRPDVPDETARLTAVRPAVPAAGPARRPPRFDPPAGRSHFDPLTTPGRPTLPPDPFAANPSLGKGPAPGGEGRGHDAPARSAQ